MFCCCWYASCPSICSPERASWFLCSAPTLAKSSPQRAEMRMLSLSVLLWLCSCVFGLCLVTNAAPSATALGSSRRTLPLQPDLRWCFQFQGTNHNSRHWKPFKADKPSVTSSPTPDRFMSLCWQDQAALAVRGAGSLGWPRVTSKARPFQAFGG